MVVFVAVLIHIIPVSLLQRRCHLEHSIVLTLVSEMLKASLGLFTDPFSDVQRIIAYDSSIWEKIYFSSFGEAMLLAQLPRHHCLIPFA